MKLSSFILAFPTIYAITIPPGAKFGINAALSEVLPFAQMEQLEQHGCWCINMNILSSKFKSEGSTTIDELDLLCKQWFQQRACTKLIDGTCFDNPTDDTYDNDLGCGALATDCQMSTCKLDEYFSNLIKDTIDSLGFTNGVDASKQECKTSSPSPESNEDKVCGRADDILFKVNRRTSVDHLIGLGASLSSDSSMLWTANTDPQVTEPETGDFNDLLGARTPQGGMFGMSGNRGLGRSAKKRNRNRNRRPAKPITPPKEPEFNFEPFKEWREFRDASEPNFNILNMRGDDWCGDIIGQGRQQGGIRTDWAFSAASIAEDSICLASRGASYDFLSTQQIGNCCDDCKGDHINTYGYASRSLDYFIREGLASGDDFMSDFRDDYKSCYPYAYGSPDFVGPLDPFELTARTGVCLPDCKHDSKLVVDETVLGDQAEVVWLTNRTEIKEHIKNHGPVIMWFQAYQDIFLYESGIYNISDHKDNHYAGNHYIKVLGWGTDPNTGTEWWECINSWKPATGDVQTIKILMGMYSTEWYAWTGIQWTNCAADQLVAPDGSCKDRLPCASTIAAPDNVILWNHYEQGELSPYVLFGSYCIATAGNGVTQIVKFSNERDFDMIVHEITPTGQINAIATVQQGQFFTTNSESGKMYLTTTYLDQTSIFWLPTNLNKVQMFEMQTDADWQMTYTHQETCQRLINVDEIAEANFNMLINDGFCDSDESGIPMQLTITNLRTDGSYILFMKIINGIVANPTGNDLIPANQSKTVIMKASNTFAIQNFQLKNLAMIGFKDNTASISIEFTDFSARIKKTKYRSN